MSEASVPAVNPAGPASPSDGAGTDAPIETNEETGQTSTPVEPGEESPEPKKAAPPPKQKFKLKFKSDDGKDAEEEFDEDQIREFRQAHQKRREYDRAASQRMEEAAKQRKEVEGLLEQLRADPRRGFRQLSEKLGVDFMDVLTKEAADFVAQQEMTPEQRELHAREQKIAQRELEHQQWEEEQKAAKQEAEFQTFQRQFATELPVLIKDFNLTDDPLTVQDIGKFAAAQISGGRPVDLREAADLVAERRENQVTSDLNRLTATPGAFAKKYPKQFEQLRREILGHANVAPVATRPTGKQTPPPTSQKAPRTWAEQEAADRRARFGIR